MLAIKLSTKSLDFLNELTISGKSRNIQTSLAMAYALAYNLELPSSKVDDITTYYKSFLELPINSQLNTINEVCVLDKQTIKDYVLNFFMLRYYTTQPSPQVMLLVKETAVLDLFKITSYIDEVALESVTADPLMFSKLVNNFVSIKKELIDIAPVITTTEEEQV